VSTVKPWRERSTQHLLDCRVFTVEASNAESPDDGSVHEFYRICSKPWVQIVPVTIEREIVLVRQYRHGSGEITREVPAGLVEPDEDPAEAAVRECLEETGYRAGNVESLGILRPNPALFDNRLHAYYALDVEKVAPIQNEGNEVTEVELIGIEDVRGLLKSGEIDHALVTAVLWRFLDALG
jgi:ADP-ribose pyrophosphatase